jgi:Fe2+ or Zn2+ uptake regulation protein
LEPAAENLDNVKNDKPVPDRNHLQNAVLQYWRNNPNAADSLQGIINWWLPKQGYEKVAMESAYQALEQLVAAGVVEKVLLVDGTVLYRLIVRVEE